MIPICFSVSLTGSLWNTVAVVAKRQTLVAYFPKAAGTR
jgi:hypothetical protein